MNGICYCLAKKSRIGSIEKSFHFLGIDYPGTQPLEDTTVEAEDLHENVHKATQLGGQRIN